MGRKVSSDSLRRQQVRLLWPLALCTVAFACHWGWQHIVLYAPIFSADPSDTARWFTNNFFAVLLSATIVLVAPALERLFERVGEVRLLVVVMVSELLGAASYIICATLADGFVEADAVSTLYILENASMVLISCGTELFGIMLVRALSCFGRSDQERITGIATVAGFVVYVLVRSLIMGLQYVFVLALPIVLAATLSRVEVKGDGRVPPVKASGVRLAGFPLRALLALCFMAMVINFMRGISSGASFETTGGVESVFASITVLAGVVLFASYFVLMRSGHDIKPLLVAVLVVISFVWAFLDDGFVMVTYSLTFAAFFVYVTILYRVMAQHANVRRAGWCRTIALGFTFNGIGLTLGSTLSRVVGPVTGERSLYAVIGVVLICSLLEAALYLSRHGKTAKLRLSDRVSEQMEVTAEGEMPQGMADIPGVNLPEGSGAPSLASIVDQDARILAEAYGLTERECDVLALLARGRNLQGVADGLSVSVNTAKSHMAHVYKKLGVHTREDLFALVEQADEERMASD